MRPSASVIATKSGVASSTATRRDCCSSACFFCVMSPDQPDEMPAAIELRLEFRDGEFQRKRRAVLGRLARHFAPDADDLLMAGLPVIGDVPVMLAMKGLGHKHIDILA